MTTEVSERLRRRLNESLNKQSEARLTLTIAEFASCVGISKNQAYSLAQRGELGVPVLRFGRRLCVPRIAVSRLLAGEPAVQPEGKGGE